MGRNADKNQQIRDQREQAILSAALALFATRGPAATRITDIAAAVSISPGLVYHYFESKDSIIYRLVDDAFAKLNGAAAELESLSVSAGDKLRLAMGGLLKTLEDSDDAARIHLFIAQTSVSDATPPVVRDVLDRERMGPYDTIARIIRAGQLEGCVHDGDAAAMAQLFWSMIKGLAIHRAVHGEAYRSPDPAAVLRVFLKEEES